MQCVQWCHLKTFVRDDNSGEVCHKCIPIIRKFIHLKLRLSWTMGPTTERTFEVFSDFSSQKNVLKRDKKTNRSLKMVLSPSRENLGVNRYYLSLNIPPSVTKVAYVTACIRLTKYTNFSLSLSLYLSIYLSIYQIDFFCHSCLSDR